jgi:hypothetical protein
MKTDKEEQTEWKRLAFSSINRNQTVHQFLRNVEQVKKPAAFEAWVCAVKEIQRRQALPCVELLDDPQHNGQYWGD